MPRSSRTLERLRLSDVDDYVNAIRQLRAMASGRPTLENMLALTLALSGRRISEVLAVEVKDVDISRRLIVFPCLKKRKVERQAIPMPPWFMDLLKRYIDGNRLRSDDKLFPVSRQKAYRIVKSLTGLNPHAFRHYFALWSLTEGGMTLEQVRRWLCHSDYDMVLEYARIVGYDFTKMESPLSKI